MKKGLTTTQVYGNIRLSSPRKKHRKKGGFFMDTTLLEQKEPLVRKDVQRSATAETKTFRVIELFAGVGGFRVGLERINKKNNNDSFKVVWSNQWEPATSQQHASDIYVKRFGKEGHANADISKADIKDIPDHDLLVGGFPCQDYSVARTLSQADGIVGKKGVLWWEIHRILKEKGNKRPSYLLLENVDRLLKSPAKHRGRDFALMLASLSDLGYIVEWRIINAADYGMPQRRRRIFILGYHQRTAIYKKIDGQDQYTDWVIKKGSFAQAFPVQADGKLFMKDFKITGDLVEITKKFEKEVSDISPFENAGVMINRKAYSMPVVPDYHGPRINLEDIVIDEKDVPVEYFIDDKDLERWKYLKGPKNEKRKTRSGYTYIYTEGGMSFPDPLNRPARTIITSEGGSNPSRFKHVVRTPSGRLRRLTPVELEKINQFPAGHTAGIPDIRRAFLMGNALVVGIVERLGQQFLKEHFANS